MLDSQSKRKRRSDYTVSMPSYSLFQSAFNYTRYKRQHLGSMPSVIRTFAHDCQKGKALTLPLLALANPRARRRGIQRIRRARKRLTAVLTTKAEGDLYDQSLLFLKCTWTEEPCLQHSARPVTQRPYDACLFCIRCRHTNSLALTAIKLQTLRRNASVRPS